MDMMICIEMVQLLFWSDNTALTEFYQNHENVKDEKKALFRFHRHAYESVKVHSLSDTNKTLSLCFLSVNFKLELVFQFQAFPMLMQTGRGGQRGVTDPNSLITGIPD